MKSHCPDIYDALDYIKLLWPDALTSLMVTETNRYARWKKRTNWVDVSRELARLLLEGGSKTRKAHPRTSDTSVCYLKKVEEIGLKRERCYHCQRTRSRRPRHTSFGCSICKVRLCKIDCFAAFHRYSYTPSHSCMIIFYYA